MTSIAIPQEVCSFCISLLEYAPKGSQLPCKNSNHSEVTCCEESWESHVQRSSGTRWLIISQLLQPFKLRCQTNEEEKYFGHPAKSSSHMIPAIATMWRHMHEEFPFLKESSWAEPHKPTEPWEMMVHCFKSLSFRVVYYVSADNWNRIKRFKMKGPKINMLHKH